MDKIYTVTTFEKFEKRENFFPETGYVRTIGWYPEEEMARNSVLRNACDMNETIYEYTMIEELEGGLYPNVVRKWFFKFNRPTRTYEEIEEIKELKGLVSIG